MVVCLLTNSEAGTLITNFFGKVALAEEVSRICTENVLANHTMGSPALGCVWILAVFHSEIDCGTDGFRISDV